VGLVSTNISSGFAPVDCARIYFKEVKKAVLTCELRGHPSNRNKKTNIHQQEPVRSSGGMKQNSKNLLLAARFGLN